MQIIIIKYYIRDQSVLLKLQAYGKCSMEDGTIHVLLLINSLVLRYVIFSVAVYVPKVT